MIFGIIPKAELEKLLNIIVASIEILGVTKPDVLEITVTTACDPSFSTTSSNLSRDDAMTTAGKAGSLSATNERERYVGDAGIRPQ